MSNRDVLEHRSVLDELRFGTFCSCAESESLRILVEERATYKRVVVGWMMGVLESFILGSLRIREKSLEIHFLTNISKSRLLASLIQTKSQDIQPTQLHYQQ
jgi:hypothetical protein